MCTCMYVCMYASTSLRICLPMCMSIIYLSICLSIYLSIIYLSIHPSIYHLSSNKELACVQNLQSQSPS